MSLSPLRRSYIYDPVNKLNTIFLEIFSLKVLKEYPDNGRISAHNFIHTTLLSFIDLLQLWALNFIPCSDRHFYCVNLNKCHFSENNISYKISINYCSIKDKLLYRIQTGIFINSIFVYL